MEHTQQEKKQLQLQKKAKQQPTQQQNTQGKTQDKKKKNKNKKKKKQKEQPKLEDIVAKNQELPPQITMEQITAETQTNERFRLLGGWDNPVKLKFPNNQFTAFPANQIQQYKQPRVKNQQLKKKEADINQHLQFLRKGAEIQRQVRRFAQRMIKPGRKLIDICEELQNYNRKLAPEKGLDSGIGFPTGCSINHCAAHYTPNPGDETVLQYNDVMKIDFGTHINGRIIDTAFTVAFNPIYDNLLASVKDATNTGIKNAGIDVRLSELGATIQQTMESYEVQLNGKMLPVKVVKNLNGHSIAPYKIHAGKTVPCVKNNSTQIMEEGEVYAIQTFGSIGGKGFVKEEGICSHYMQDFNIPIKPKIPARSKNFFQAIQQKFGTLCFCKRWLQRMQIPNYILPLKDLVGQGLINPYPPLCDVEGSYVAQYEHTLILRPLCKQILSRGDDY